MYSNGLFTVHSYRKCDPDCTTGAKQSRNHLMATATQEGTVELLSIAPRDVCDPGMASVASVPSGTHSVIRKNFPEPQRVTIHAHNNAIFDVRWSPDDSHIVSVFCSLYIRVCMLTATLNVIYFFK